MVTRVLWLFALCVALSPLSAMAQASPPPDVAQKIIAYMDGIRSFKARFDQSDDSGLPSSGWFYMNKPSKIRWEYDPPSYLLIIINGKVMAVVDRELDEVRNVPIDGSLAALPAMPAQSLFDGSGDVRVTDYREEGGAYFVTFAQKDKSREGSLTLEFSAPNVALAGFSQTDPSGRRVDVRFSQTAINPSLPRKLFLLPKGRSRPGKR